MTITTETHQTQRLQDGAVFDAPLNALKPSPRNARRTPHSPAAVEAMAASIAAKGVLQAPVVEPEVDAAGEPTGCYFVTIGECRRLALKLLAKRKVIKKTHPVRCVLDLSHDPHEISLDENVTRSNMHPADQFEAFRRLAEERGLGAEEIGARFGVSAHVVRQRLRLGAVSPKLMALYRAEELTLDQLMAFAVSEDHARQEQVLEQLSWNRSPHVIRRAMTEAKVPASDRRARFVGVEAYAEAGGTILRDLFTEDGGGWFEDVALLDRLVSEKLEALAMEVRDQEGWRWAEAHIDYPHAHGLPRAYPQLVERSEEDRAVIAALSEEYDAMLAEWEAVEDVPSEVDARFQEIDAALQRFGDLVVYDPEDIARGGVLVVLGHDGVARIERGFIRPEDQPQAEPNDGDAPPDTEGVGASPATSSRAETEGADGATAPLSDRLILDLTAQRTLALRDRLAAEPVIALAAVTHSLALFAFYPPYERASCLEIKAASIPLAVDASAGEAVAERHARWAARLPKAAAEAWAFVSALGSGELLDLLAHCASLTLNAVRTPLEQRPQALAHADALAEAVDLDMRAYWTADARRYFDRVTKAQIVQAVREGVSDQAATRIAGLNKPDMAAEAARLLEGRGWLPSILRRPGEAPPPVVADVDEDVAAGVQAAA